LVTEPQERTRKDRLNPLAKENPTAADRVHLHFFAGLPLAEVAQLLGISPRTANRLWVYARAWLHQQIQGTPPKSEKIGKRVA
jgi:DNA-directed RNA polymerase specialized sigma24 family protein